MKDPVIIMPATDRRLAVVKQLAEARRHCKEDGRSFKDWVYLYTPYKYSTAIKYARIGDKALPLERLITSRTQAQMANRKMRAKKRVADSLGSLSGCKAMYARLNQSDQMAFRDWLNKKEGD